MWIVEREHRSDEDGDNIAVEFRDSDGLMRANVRWDGCIQIWLHNRTEEGNERFDTIHTCDISELIGKLEALRTASQDLFHGNGYWSTSPADQTSDELSFLPEHTAEERDLPSPP
jgi:predicted TPR repeat methyltransferase